jgi:hypothetical protein
MQRLIIVDELAEWVKINLANVEFQGSRSHMKKMTDKGRKKKSLQYVYEYLAVGKMFFPFDKFDPLFTSKYYKDTSMELQLINGQYSEFIREVNSSIQGLHEVFKTQVFGAEDEITWEDLEAQLMKMRISETEDSEMEKVCSILETRAVKDKIQNLRRALHFKTRKSDDWVEQQLIGLVLRYACMGAFGNNLHGSVSSDWPRLLGDDYVECFASPFNHKFPKYYSIYEQDRVFGSLGNFFAFMEKTEYILPSDGKYEINPVWNNQMYEQIQLILDKTLASKSKIQAIIVGPDWEDTTWIPGITELIGLNHEYSENSFAGLNKVGYRNDMMNSRFSQDTRYWVFSTVMMDDSILEKLEIPNPKKKKEKKTSNLLLLEEDPDERHRK